MPSESLNAHEKQGRTYSEWVWFEGTTALLEGQGVCYNFDYGTATAADARRYNRVEVPSITNARHFAGVASRAYSAKDTGQMIEVYKPGSVCNILVGASQVIGVGRITCEVTATVGTNGMFRLAGFEGEGSAVPLQTVTYVATPLLCLAKLETGEPSGLVEDVLPVDNTAITCMVGGVTYFTTAVTLTADDSTFTLADGTIPGLRKAFVCQAALTTHGVLVTVTSGEQGILNADPTVDLASFTLDADLEEIALQWNAFDTSGVWNVLHCVGATIA